MKRIIFSILLVLSFGNISHSQQHFLSDMVYTTASIGYSASLHGHRQFFSSGSGLQFSGDDSLFLVITARHVVDSLLAHHIDTIYVRPSWADSIPTWKYLGIPIPLIRGEKVAFFYHPDSTIDLAALIIQNDVSDTVLFSYLKSKPMHYWSKDALDTSILLGEDIYVTGYPAHIEDVTNNQLGYNLCILKKGIVSWSSTNTHSNLDNFAIIETSSIYGNSGGPVFTLSHFDRNGTLTNTRLGIVGINTNIFNEMEDVYIRGQKISQLDIFSTTKSGQGSMVRSNYIFSLVNSIDLHYKTHPTKKIFWH